MPKFNMYQALHTTVIGPEGRPLEIQIRTMEMHRTAEYGVAAHWIYKVDGSKPIQEQAEWLRHLLDWQDEMKDPQEFAETLRADLFEDEVFVFTPKGEVKSLAAGATPLDFAYSIHTDVGHRCVGAKVNGKIVPLHYELQSGDICEVLTSKKERGPSRDWLALAKTTRAQSKIRAWFKRERREDSERTGRETLHEHLKRAGLPPQRIAGSPLLADVIREMGFRKGEDFYIALGQAKISPKTVTSKLMHRLKEGEAAVEPASAASELLERRETPKKTAASSNYGIKVEGVDDVMLRLAKCCRPVPGDPIVGYISLGKGITIHHDHCPNAEALKRNPERFTPVAWEGDTSAPFRVELQIDGWDRTRMLEDLSRTFAETGINILEARCTVVHPMVKNRFVVEVGDTQALKTCIARLRNIESVFDAYRVTPTGRPRRCLSAVLGGTPRGKAPSRHPPRRTASSRRRTARPDPQRWRPEVPAGTESWRPSEDSESPLVTRSPATCASTSLAGSPEPAPDWPEPSPRPSRSRRPPEAMVTSPGAEEHAPPGPPVPRASIACRSSRATRGTPVLSIWATAARARGAPGPKPLRNTTTRRWADGSPARHADRFRTTRSSFRWPALRGGAPAPGCGAPVAERPRSRLRLARRPGRARSPDRRELPEARTGLRRSRNRERHCRPLRWTGGRVWKAGRPVGSGRRAPGRRAPGRRAPAGTACWEPAPEEPAEGWASAAAAESAEAAEASVAAGQPRPEQGTAQPPPRRRLPSAWPCRPPCPSSTRFGGKMRRYVRNSALS